MLPTRRFDAVSRAAKLWMREGWKGGGNLSHLLGMMRGTVAPSETKVG